MNKKFSTLMMAGMLVAGSSFSALNAQVKLNNKPLAVVKAFETAADKDNSGDYIVVRDANNNGKVDANDYILIAEKNQLGEITYSSKKITADNVTITDETTAVWTLTEKDNKAVGATEASWLYGLKSKNTGYYLTVKNGAIQETVSDSKDALTLDLDNTVGSTFCVGQGNDSKTRIAQNSTLYTYKTTNGANGFMANSGGWVIGDPSGNHYGLLFVTFAERTVDFVDELNDIKGGKGFQFSFPDQKDKTIIDNIFANQDVRAFRVKMDYSDPTILGDSIGWVANGNYYEIPAGTYLATDWSGLSEETLANNTITTKEEFQKATFIAIDPQDFTKITNTERKNGVGFTLATVKGSDMNFYDAETNKAHNKYDGTLESSNADVFVGNACFAITVPDPLAKNDQYNLAVKNARLDLKDDDAHAAKGVVISVVSNTNNVDDATTDIVYLVTNTSKAATVKAVPSSNIADVTELLNEDATPAIYAIKFISGADAEDGEVSEYGQYLTVESNGSTSPSNSWRAVTMPNANENDPLYQFVLSGVKDFDKDGNYETLVATNRQTKVPFSAVLYKEEALGDNVYTIYPDKELPWENIQVATDEDGKLKFKKKSFKGMLVQLIEKENVDKFATFETAESEEGLYTFEFAKTAESEDRLFAAATRNTDDEIQYTGRVVTATTADQFELIRVKESNGKDKVTNILNDFIYLSNGTVKTSAIEKDTVAYYSYNVRYFAPDQNDEYYLKSGSLATTPSAHIIKYNADGSVSLFDEAATNDFITTAGTPNAKAQYLAMDALKGASQVNEKANIGKSAWTWGDYYLNEGTYNATVKTFMVQEKVYGTLNPIAQTTAFENEFGYVNMNADKAGILKPAESMTFRLDTVDSDKNIPSFYISKEIDGVHHFMYFAKDSAESYRLTSWQKYAFENGSTGSNNRATRLIFKAGQLVDTDTLKTMIDGKSTFVAEKANAVKGVKGGLNNFKFQVIESGDDDDTYVIRNKATRSYVININGNLTLGSSLAGATRFTVDPDETVANEAVGVSSIEVIAGNGYVTVIGAQGKKVAISNVLGQTVANTVISSDNATIAAPAGVVVVAVEGEAAVKAIVK
ncbi:DUF6383 domain-containing protein [Parabacteroides gordonii]|uniref:DUF6383 domain-containing protein n=1 Tax=Parabacteroides gordonii MS-1 = DSM 23371 TaxID=1203610 RepID=A0A0F5JCW9_9BACT|nr:DUF6383 domain-containing protein [Parabacteroides gordonii]KKB55370.1 hypothetical protein HMPREF1536_02839 [Parabacteroides gordonii MS-1 = DSM 23371]